MLHRVYGETHDNTERVLKEVIVSCTLSCKKIGPKVFGILPFGRIEEYLNVIYHIDLSFQLLYRPFLLTISSLQNYQARTFSTSKLIL